MPLYVDQLTDTPDASGCSHAACARPAFVFSFGESRENTAGHVTGCCKHARRLAEAEWSTQPKSYPVSVWTGPVIAEVVAAHLRGLALPARAGTERVYFTVEACSRDEAHLLALEAVRKFSGTFMHRDVAVSASR